jgi:hypothetical protein
LIRSAERRIGDSRPQKRYARATLLARYFELRSSALDAVLKRAGILRFFADHLNQAGTVPVWNTPPRPKLNRPYPPEGER